MNKESMDAVTFLKIWDEVCDYRCHICELGENNNGFDVDCGEFAKIYPEIFIEAVMRLKIDKNLSFKGEIMKKEFCIDYVVADDVRKYCLGQEVYIIDSFMKNVYTTCDKCNHQSLVESKREYKINEATISGFTIAANHCFSYNLNNSFTLRIQLIDEHEQFKDPWEIFFDEKTAELRIQELKRRYE